MTDGISQTIDFGGALLLLRSGIPVKRLEWANKRPKIEQKLKVELTPDGKGLRTTFLNCYSDRCVFSVGDILAKDWIEVEL